MDAVLEASRLAPTACNNQPQRILVLDTAEALDKLKDCTPCHFSASPRKASLPRVSTPELAVGLAPGSRTLSDSLFFRVFCKP